VWSCHLVYSACNGGCIARAVLAIRAWICAHKESTSLHEKVKWLFV
jgi:hypothetical protein